MSETVAEKPHPTEGKRCAYCGKQLARKMRPSGLESISAYKARRHCDLACWGRAKSRDRGTLHMGRLAYLQDGIRAGKTFDELGQDIGMTKQGISDWLKRHQQGEGPLRICNVCGRPIEERDLRLRHHRECFENYAALYGRKHSHHQRETLSWSEQIAVEEYAARGIAVSYVPYHAPFDFWMNGVRIEVKGSHLVHGRGYHWGLAPNGRKQASAKRLHYDELSKRYDVLHCIGEDGEGRHHLLIPVAEIGSRTAVVWRPPCVHSRGSIWDRYVDNWDLLNGNRAGVLTGPEI